MPYQTIDHTADIGITVRTGDVETLFKEAARAVSELIFGARPFTATGEIQVKVTGSDWPDLMINWLRELLYLVNGEGMIPGPVGIRKLEAFTLDATVPVDKTGYTCHAILSEIKAVTYHQIQVERRAAGWQARIIFDS
jgi:SHS2 domain-containing protein